ncbi:hypothetical protein [Campylobacter troglodytis]|nr:hypothetical protein [Campylobacter troglodytis]
MSLKTQAFLALNSSIFVSFANSRIATNKASLKITSKPYSMMMHTLVC